jgi:hypothetical protein
MAGATSSAAELMKQDAVMRRKSFLMPLFNRKSAVET